MTVKHTPGPWHASAKYVFAGKECVAICDTENFSKSKERANASLIAAAPDMRAAGDELANAAGDIHPTAPSSKSIERLHAAIDLWGAAVDKAKCSPLPPK